MYDAAQQRRHASREAGEGERNRSGVEWVMEQSGVERGDERVVLVEMTMVVMRTYERVPLSKPW